MCLKLACHAIVGWIAIAIVLPSVGCSQRNTTTKEQVRTTTQDQVRVEKTTNTESEQDWPRFLGNRFDGSVEQSRVSIDWGTPPVAAWSMR